MGILLGASGYAGAGKDQLAKMLIERDGFTRISFADKVRDYALAINPKFNVSQSGVLMLSLQEIVQEIGWEAAKRQYPEVRKFIIGVGHGAREAFGYDIWVNLALPDKKILPERVIVTDVRYMNEFNRITDFGGINIRIVREGVEAPFDHITEKPLPADYTVENVNGNIEIMYNQVRKILDG